jgi:hypothetical protein
MMMDESPFEYFECEVLTLPIESRRTLQVLADEERFCREGVFSFLGPVPEHVFDREFARAREKWLLEDTIATMRAITHHLATVKCGADLIITLN